MKTHLSFATADLGKSVAYYATLLDARPEKNFPDYALFTTELSGLELALNPSVRVSPANDSHFGIGVLSVDLVDQALLRLETAGYDVEVEREQTCCYANQTKVWSTDPDGRRWEVYVVHNETDTSSETVTPTDDPDAQNAPRGERACCAP